MANQGGLGLSFERADYAEGADSGPPCGACQGPLKGQYWQWQKQMLCAGCRERFAGELAASQSAASLGAAALRGGAVALGCGIAYAIFVAATDIQFALITIGIGFLIAKVVRKASRGIGGRRFQVLAVVLTYLASAMGYAPAVWKGVKSAAKEPTAQVAPAAPAGSAEPTPTAKPVSPGPSSDAKAKPSVGGLVAALAFLFALTLAAPILAAPEAPLGLLIVLFGLWEAWKLSRGLPLTIEGPFRVSPPSTGPPAT